jgi:hypothetical protein
VCNILVGKPKGKRPLGRPMHRWENNIRMQLWEIGWEGVDLIHLAQDRDQWLGPSEHSNEHLGSIRGREFLYKLSDY